MSYSVVCHYFLISKTLILVLKMYTTRGGFETWNAGIVKPISQQPLSHRAVGQTIPFLESTSAFFMNKRGFNEGEGDIWPWNKG